MAPRTLAPYTTETSYHGSLTSPAKKKRQRCSSGTRNQQLHLQSSAECKEHIGINPHVDVDYYDDDLVRLANASNSVPAVKSSHKMVLRGDSFANRAKCATLLHLMTTIRLHRDLRLTRPRSHRSGDKADSCRGGENFRYLAARMWPFFLAQR